MFEAASALPSVNQLALSLQRIGDLPKTTTRPWAEQWSVRRKSLSHPVREWFLGGSNSDWTRGILQRACLPPDCQHVRRHTWQGASPPWAALSVPRYRFRFPETEQPEGVWEN